jgi:hypothetical protein
MMANPTDAAIDSRAFFYERRRPACVCCHRAGTIALHAVLELYAATIGLSTLCFVPNRMILMGFSIMAISGCRHAPCDMALGAY